MADFALELLKFTPPKESNIMSPLSLVAALSVLERAAGGSTKSQIANALRRTSDADVPELIRALAAADGVLMAVATKFYLANGTNLHEDYKSTVTKEFDVATECLDFRNQKLTVETVNNFVSEATRGMLPKLLSDDFSNPEMRALLVNAVYFKGEWANRFSPDATQTDVFHGINGDRQEPFMFMREMKTCRYAAAEEADVLALPYKDHNYEFVIFLPQESVPFEKFREEFTGEKLRELLKYAYNDNSGVNVRIPKFKLSSQPNIKDMLTMLGITDLFSECCNLEAMSPDPLFVSDAIHKAVIEVNEEGSEAAAASGLRIHLRTLRNIFPVFRADRPFLYGVFRADEPLFIGQFC